MQMLHILDPDHLKAQTVETVDRLISEIILPPDVTNLMNDGVHTSWDRVGIWHAVAVLMPLAAVEILRPPLKAGRISIERIAEIAELPLFAVAVAMSDAWPNLHSQIVKKYERIVM
jgi:hypothetical protein